MEDHEKSNSGSRNFASTQEKEMTIPQLVGTIYGQLPPNERCQILEFLMKPLGALALIGVGNGVFAKIWFRSGWHDLHIRPDDAQTVQVIDVVSLVDYVQQASSETIYGLASLLAASPTIACSAATAMLVNLLVQRIRTART